MQDWREALRDASARECRESYLGRKRKCARGPQAKSGRNVIASHPLVAFDLLQHPFTVVADAEERDREELRYVALGPEPAGRLQ